jgi:hypothetical protein
LSHKRAKFQFQIQKILGYTKVTNVWIWVCIFQISKFQQILSFLCSLQYKEYHIKILHACRLLYLLCLHSFSDFFETNMYAIWFFLNSRALVPISQRHFSQMPTIKERMVTLFYRETIVFVKLKSWTHAVRFLVKSKFSRDEDLCLNPVMNTFFLN